jgi:hypothetical protein
MVLEITKKTNGSIDEVVAAYSKDCFYEQINDYIERHKEHIKKENIPLNFKFIDLPIDWEITWEDKHNNYGSLTIKEVFIEVEEDIDVNLEFGGFYESIHSEILDNMVECEFMDESGNLPEDFEWDKVNYKKLYEVYAKLYTNKMLPKWIINKYEEEHEFTIPENLLQFKYQKLVSPMFYNYSTDTIKVKLPKDTANFIIKLYQKMEEFDTYVREWLDNHESTSNYSYTDIIENKDNMFVEFVLMYESELLNSKLYSGEIEGAKTYIEYIEEEICYQIEIEGDKNDSN